MKLCGADIKEKDHDSLSFWKTEHRPRREVKQGVAYLFPFYFLKYTIGERSRCLMSVCDTSKWNNLKQTEHQCVLFGSVLYCTLVKFSMHDDSECSEKRDACPPPFNTQFIFSDLSHCWISRMKQIENKSTRTKHKCQYHLSSAYENNHRHYSSNIGRIGAFHHSCEVTRTMYSYTCHFQWF